MIVVLFLKKNFLENIEFIMDRSFTNRQEIIDLFKSYNIRKLPDGRKIEDIVLDPADANEILRARRSDGS